jgi:hypothetical protein
MLVHQPTFARRFRAEADSLVWPGWSGNSVPFARAIRRVVGSRVLAEHNPTMGLEATEAETGRAEFSHTKVGMIGVGAVGAATSLDFRQSRAGGEGE